MRCYKIGHYTYKYVIYLQYLTNLCQRMHTWRLHRVINMQRSRLITQRKPKFCNLAFLYKKMHAPAALRNFKKINLKKEGVLSIIFSGFYYSFVYLPSILNNCVILTRLINYFTNKP